MHASVACGIGKDIFTGPPNATVLFCSLVSVGVCRLSFSSVVVCNDAGGRASGLAAGRAGGRADDISRRASRVKSR